MSYRVPTLREYVDYVESYDRPLDIDALIVEGWARRAGPSARTAGFDGATDAHALGLARGETVVAALEPATVERSGRRRWPFVVVAAALAAAVLVVAVLEQGTAHQTVRTRIPAGPSRSVTTAPAPSTGVSTNSGVEGLLPAADEVPSKPKEGQLVAVAVRPAVGPSYFYADGRLIWLDDVDGASRWVEQRLTPDGVEQIRREFLASGLFNPKEGIAGPDQPSEYLGPRVEPGGCGGVCVRHNARVLERTELTAEEQQIVDRLATSPSSLPATDWVDQQIRSYVPATYAVCLVQASPRTVPSVGPDPSAALKALPTRAAKLLRARESIGDVGMEGATCFQVPTGKARTLANELVDAYGAADRSIGVHSSAFEITADVNRPHLESFGVQFWPLLPHGERALYYQW